MRIAVTNAQRDHPVSTTAVAELARRAVRALRVRTRGTLSITFLDAQHMRMLNRRFLRHDRPTDVLSFRYDGERVAGEIFIGPHLAHAYAREHRVPYREELARYVVHGILHWLGHDDSTIAQQRAMRHRENRLLAACSK